MTAAGAADVPAPRLVRGALVVMTASAAFVGAWALAAPESFYRSFPGLGRQWVAGDGPFNEHLVRDVGGLNLALAVVSAFAAVWLGRRLVLATCCGWLAYSLPHLAYHATHGGGLGGADVLLVLSTLTVSATLPACVALGVLLAPAPPGRPADVASPNPNR